MSRYYPKRVKLEDVTLIGEVWKDIDGYVGEYKVSDQGRVFSLISGKIMRPILNVSEFNGYIQIPLGRREMRKSHRLHRLVAKAFLPNPHNKSEVNHKNKNRLDNCVVNLEWMTPYENTQHKYGIDIWHADQLRIAPSHHSVASRKLRGFSESIIPQIHKYVPLN